MGRKRSKHWKMTHFSLSVDCVEKLKVIAEFKQCSQTQVLEEMILEFDESQNPEIKFRNLMKKRDDLSEQIAQLDAEVKKAGEHMAIFNEWGKQKSIKKEKAIKILEGVILNREFDRAEGIAKTWQRMTGVPAAELMVEARDNVLKRGI